MQTETAGQEIPAPPGFPVEWESPEDAVRLWERERMHVPKQATVLDDDFMQRWINGGFNGACAAYDLPVRNRYRRFNTYEYQSIAPVSHDPAELEEIGRRAQEKVGAVLGRQLELWEAERLPEIKGYLAGWEAFDLAGSSSEAFRGHFDLTVARSTRSWEIHFVTVLPAVLGMSIFQDAYQELLGASGDLEPYVLLQGLPNHSTEADRALYELSRGVRESATVAAVLERTAGDVRAELEASPEGRAFFGELRGFLERYGKRQDGYISVSEPSWIEQPQVVLAALRDYAAQPERDPDAELARLAAAREEAVAGARGRLEGLPPEAAGKFEFLLDVAQQSSVMQENHNFWIDGQVVYQVRRVVLEAGRRLAGAGAIAEPGDVFHLTIEEILEALASGGDLRAAVGERVAELERFAAAQAPPVLGTFPPGPPPDDPFSRAIFRMFGTPQEQPADVTLVKGLAGSPGVVRGRARVLRSLADSDRLEHGEILVTETTSPPWTPLFQTAAAVVTDVGGILSHCAVVAREYMIPAVVGTSRATAVIRDGMLVEVDGGEGLVRIVEEA